MKGRFSAILSRLKQHQMWIVLLLILFVLGATVLSLLNYDAFDPQIGRYRGALLDGDYVMAGKYFADDIRGDLELEQYAQGLVVRQIEVLKEAYVEQELSEEEMRAALDQMRENRLLTDTMLIDLAEEDITVLTLSREAFGAGRRAELLGDFGEAIRLYTQVQLLDPNYDETEVRLGDLRGRYIRVTEEEVRSSIDRGKYEDAEAALIEADELIPGERTWTELRTYLDVARAKQDRQAVLDRSVTLIENESYEQALKHLARAVRLYPDDATIVKAHLDIQALIERLAITRAKSAWAEGDQAQALGYLEDALELLPDSPYLTTWRNTYSSATAPEPPETGGSDIEGIE